MPPVFRAMVPRLSNDDKKVVRNVEKLLGFFLGAGADGFSLPSPLAFMPSPFIGGPRGSSNNGGLLLAGIRGGSGTTGSPLQALGSVRSQAAMARELAPVLRELSPQMRQFGLQIVARLNDRLASRFLRFAKDTLLGPEA